MNLAETAATLERPTALRPRGKDVFRGYGVMGVHFSSGYVLALRRFPASSIGPGYTSVWVRTPAGGWSFYADVGDGASCARYFGPALDGSEQTGIRLAWSSERSLTVEVPAIGLVWRMEFRHSAMSRLLDAVARRIPESVARRPAVLTPMTRVASRLLGLGTLRLRGTMPNGQPFLALPRRICPSSAVSASLGGASLGDAIPAAPQASIGEFVIPRRGLFVVGIAEMSLPGNGPSAPPALLAGLPGLAFA